ncbi:MAG: hypothetical protein WBM41_15090 [Arenicellales bacterium]
MSENTILFYAVLVFVLMLIGLVLTAIEFKFGAPRKQEEAAKAKKSERNAPGLGQYVNIESR